MSRKVLCELCPTECQLDNYEIGGCRTRINKDGVLFSLVYGKPCAVAVDPIEKKPFFSFPAGNNSILDRNSRLRARLQVLSELADIPGKP